MLKQYVGIASYLGKSPGLMVKPFMAIDCLDVIRDMCSSNLGEVPSFVFSSVIGVDVANTEAFVALI